MSARKNRRLCLNCGNKAAGNFFPHCGQPTSTARLSTPSFLGQTLINLLRLNRGFLFTAGRLVWKPWTVIRDYIHGRRVNYTAPVQMLILLCLVRLVLAGLLNLEKGIDNFVELSILKSGSLSAEAINTVVWFYLSSPTLQYLTIFLPCAIAARLVYKKQGSRRFNTAEYLVATIYMADAMLTFDILTMPVDLLLPDISALLNFLYIATMSAITLTKAFPTARLKTAGLLLKFSLTVTLLYLIILVALCIAIASIIS